MRLRVDGFWREPPSDTIIIAEPAVSSMLDLLFLSDNLAISIFSAVFHKFVSSDLCGSSTNGGRLFPPKYPPGALARRRIVPYSKKTKKRRIQAMHMADALLSPAVAVTMYAASAAAAGVSLVQLHKEETAAPETAKKKLPTMAVMSALVFAGQMINYTIPGTGSSGHLCGGMLLSAMLGRWAGFLSMIVILAIQALFFADGGLLAQGGAGDSGSRSACHRRRTDWNGRCSAMKRPDIRPTWVWTKSSTARRAPPRKKQPPCRKKHPSCRTTASQTATAPQAHPCPELSAA